MSDDRFESLVDEFQAKKRALQEKSLTLTTPIDELPCWEDVKNIGQDNTCIICRRNFRDSDLVEKCVICNIYFHSKELRQWVKTSKTCPSCKNMEI